METVKEIFQSIYDSYRDRIKSPLIGSFIITYLIFNWRLVAILFYSEWPIHCRIEWIEENYCEWYHYVVPFLIALLYVLGLPYLNLEFEKFLEKYTNTKLDKKNNSKLDALDQKEKEAKKKRLIADAEAGTSEITALNERIESLQTENKNLTKQNQDDLNRHNAALDKYKLKESELLRQIDNLTLFSDIDWAKSELSDDIEFSKKMLNEVKAINSSFTDNEKSNYISFVQAVRKNIDVVLDLQAINKYRKLELIETENKNHKYQHQLTNKGKLFFEYLNSGRDLQ